MVTTIFGATTEGVLPVVALLVLVVVVVAVVVGTVLVKVPSLAEGGPFGV